VLFPLAVLTAIAFAWLFFYFIGALLVTLSEPAVVGGR
jgi:hypothetical protein